MNILGIGAVIAASIIAPPKEPLRIGDVKIIGNTVTRDSVIRNLANLYPGQVLTRKVVQQAQENLIRSGLFEVESKKNEGGTTVEVEVDNEQVYKSILIRVREKERSLKIRLDARLDSRYLPIVRLVVEQPNFDPAQWPVCWDDIRENRAFRGAGKLLRFELIRLNALWGRVDIFHQDVTFPETFEWWVRPMMFYRDKHSILLKERPLVWK